MRPGGSSLSWAAPGETESAGRYLIAGIRLLALRPLENNRSRPEEKLTQQDKCHRNELRAPWRDVWPFIHLGMKIL
jgi:hypothetical protein